MFLGLQWPKMHKIVSISSGVSISELTFTASKKLIAMQCQLTWQRKWDRSSTARSTYELIQWVGYSHQFPNDYCSAIITDRMPQSGKLPVLNLLTGQKSGFSPRRGDSLHRFTSNFAGPTGTWARLAVQNFTSIPIRGWECGPKISKISFFL